jgi:hypothetical protein
MSQTAEGHDPLARACELVGRFNYHFSRLEQKLNASIAKLFKLDDVSADILTANIDFSRKVNIVRSAVTAQNASPGEKWLTEEIKSAFNGVLEINNERLIVAHSPFEVHADGGVVFDRTVAREELKRNEIVWSEQKFGQHFDRMRLLERELENVLRHIEPYVPRLDFSDPRNSGYLPLLT